MLKRNKKFNEGVAVGIRSFQGRLNSLSNSINEKYNTIIEHLDQFDKINDQLIDEMQKLQIRDTYGLIEENEYDRILSKNIKILLCSYMIDTLENNLNYNQYNFFKGCCVKLQNFETVDGLNYLEELADECNVKQAEIVVKLLLLFLSLGDTTKEYYDLFNSDALDDFTISSRKIKTIEKYIESMKEIYGNKLCYIYGMIDDESFKELSMEVEITDPQEMYELGLQLISEKKYGLKWIMNAASRKNQDALMYLNSHYLKDSTLIGISNSKLYYTDKRVPFSLMCMDEWGNSRIIYTFNKKKNEFSIIDSSVCYKEYIAFGIKCFHDCFLFSVNTKTDLCTYLDDWYVTSMQCPFICLDNQKVKYGLMEFDIGVIRNNSPVETYRIGFDGKNKEIIYD